MSPIKSILSGVHTRKFPMHYVGKLRMIRSMQARSWLKRFFSSDRPVYSNPHPHLISMASVQFNWNVFPSTKLEESRMVTPLGCLVTPFSDNSVPFSTSIPLTCSSCGSFINSHIRIDRVNRMWWCPMCRKTTFFPDSFQLHERNSSDSDIALEIRPSEHNTVDYLLPTDITSNDRTAESDLIFGYIIDVYQDTDSMELKEYANLINAVLVSIRKLPANAKILIITFSDVVEIHQPKIKDSIKFSPETFFKSDDNNYSKVFTDKRIFERIMSRFSSERSGAHSTTFDMAASNILSCPDAELIEYLKGLKPKLTQSLKPPRSTGLAIFLAVSICNTFSRPNTLGKLMIFLGGPVTLNPGKIVSPNENIRSHRDIANFRAPHFTAASKFYRVLAYISVGYSPLDAYTCVYSAGGKLVNCGVPENAPRFSVDIYTGSLDQVGIYEMKSLSEAGGGTISTSESFSSVHFQESLQKNIAGFLTSNHSCKLTILSSRGIKVMKMVGNGTELRSSYQSEKLSELHHEKISDTVTCFDSSLKKKNSTNQWFIGNVASDDTFAVFLEVDTASSSSKLNLENAPSEAFIQFQLKYWSMSKNSMMLRVVTVMRHTSLAVLAANKVRLPNGTTSKLNTKGNIAKERLLLEGFNARVWITLLTRLLVSKIDTAIGYENFESVVDEVDKSLVKLLHCYGGVTVESGTFENPHQNIKQVYSMCEKFVELPDYAYNLRRNPQLISIFNSSPDETAFNHHIFFKCDSKITCQMISPALYRVEKHRLVNLPLNRDSLQISSGNVFFVLDCICHLIIYNQFSNQVDKLPLHPSSNDHLELAQSDAKFAHVLSTVNMTLLCNRSVNPKIVVTQSGHSQSRFLFSRLETTKVFEKEQKKNDSSWWGFMNLFGSKRSVVSSDMTFADFNEKILERVKKFSMERDL